MNINANIGIKFHNRFDFVITDVKTGKTSKAYAEIKPQAENIVLERMYTRLLQGLSFFDHIVFGTGTGTPTPDRTELFNRVGSKPAVTEILVRSFPASRITKRIRLETGDHNGVTLTEVGISDTTTSINTHAMITDSEGVQIQIPKSSDIIIDVYATVYVEVYSVDSGLFFYGTGLRDYLTGGSEPSSVLRLFEFSDDTSKSITGTRTYDLTEKTITVTGKFSVYDFNRDVRAIDWRGMGLRWLIPRPGVYTGTPLTNVELGVGDGVKTEFTLPNKEVSNLTIKIDGSVTTGYTFDEYDQIVFNTAPSDTLNITADYTAKYVPKSEKYELNVTASVKFAISQPSPVVPAPDYSSVPGPQTLVAGDAIKGYFGEVSAEDFISGADLCSLLGITQGTLINSEAGWAKLNKENRILMLSKMCIRHSISWDQLNALGLIYGKQVVIGNNLYIARILSSTEWNELVYPLHVNYGQFAQFTDAQLGISGIYTWTSTISGTYRVLRGYTSVVTSITYSPSRVNSTYGFRPVLEFIRPLTS